uniref:Uncharacterized protein n=1 Tax=Tetranychus urticae TaxID=32264 RepID=T1KIV0_TETUR
MADQKTEQIYFKNLPWNSECYLLTSSPIEYPFHQGTH